MELNSKALFRVILGLVIFVVVHSTPCQASYSLPANTNVHGEVRTIVWDSMRSNLYIGGQFDSINGHPYANIAKWNSQEGWSNMAGGLPGGIGVNALEIANGVLIAGGAFEAKITSQWCLVGWNDTAWVSLGADIPRISGNYYLSEVRSLAWTDSTLFVGGLFHEVAGQITNSLAAFQNSKWIAFDSNGVHNSAGMPPVINSFAVGHKCLYIGGLFDKIGDSVAESLGYINTPDLILQPLSDPVWQPAYLPLYSVTALLFKDGILYFGGDFDSINHTPVKGFGCWDGIKYRAIQLPSEGQNFTPTIASFAKLGNQIACVSSLYPNSEVVVYTFNPLTNAVQAIDVTGTDGGHVVDCLLARDSIFILGGKIASEDGLSIGLLISRPNEIKSVESDFRNLDAPFITQSLEGRIAVHLSQQAKVRIMAYNELGRGRLIFRGSMEANVISIDKSTLAGDIFLLLEINGCRSIYLINKN